MAASCHIEIAIQQEDFSHAEIYAQMRQRQFAQAGSIVSFVGLVRDRNERAGDGGEVQGLSLEHYPGMTEHSMQKIAEQAQERWPLLQINIIHRVGDLLPDDQIVMVLVASAHRSAAFAAAEYLMDFLKTEAILWKLEKSSLGTKWLRSTTEDHDRSAAWGDGKIQQGAE